MTDPAKIFSAFERPYGGQKPSSLVWINRGGTMFYGYVEKDVYQTTEKILNRKARDAWRFRHLKSQEAKIATAVLTSILNLFIR